MAAHYVKEPDTKAYILPTLFIGYCVLWPYLYDILEKAKLATENRAAVARGRGGGRRQTEKGTRNFLGP